MPVPDFENFKDLVNQKDNLSNDLKKSINDQLRTFDLKPNEINEFKSWLDQQLKKVKISKNFKLDKFNDRPRYLSDNEIWEILKVVPKVQALTEEVGNKVRNEICRTFFLQIKNCPISPSKIEDLKKNIVNQCVRSVIDPGESVGLKTGEAQGQPMMQMTLNSFHQAGSATANQSGIETYKEIISVTKNRKFPKTTLHFKNKDYTLHQIINISNNFTGVSLNNLLKDPIRSREIKDSKNPKEWWYLVHSLVFGELDQNFKSRQFLRLHLDTQKLYNYSITLDKIVSIIEKLKFDSNFIAKCVYSPNNIGIIDIYFNKLISSPESGSNVYKNRPHIASAITDDNATVVFIQVEFLKILDDILIKGIKGIKNALPAWVATIDMIRGVEPLDGKRKWILWLDDIRLKITGIDIPKIIRLLEASGCEVLSNDDKHIKKVGQPYSGLIEIQMPEQSPYPLKMNEDSDILSQDIPITMKPDIYISKLLAEEDSRLLEWENTEKEKFTSTDGQEGQKYPIPDYTNYPVLFHGKYYYLIAEGLNLKTILAHPLIDSARTISNDFHEVKDVRGLVASKNVIAREIFELIDGSGSYISPRHISLLVDVMTVLGLLVPVSSRGVARLNRGAFADACFENVTDAFKKSAIFGKYEEVVNTSASILMGLPIKLGTGSFQLQHDSQALKLIDELAIKENLEDVLGIINNLPDDIRPEQIEMRKAVDDHPTVDDELPEEDGMSVITLPNGRILQVLKTKEAIKPLIVHINNGTINSKGPIPEIRPVTVPVTLYQPLIDLMEMKPQPELSFDTLKSLAPHRVKVDIPTGNFIIPTLPDITNLKLS